MSYENSILSRLPPSVQEYAVSHDEIGVNEMPTESINWGLHGEGDGVAYHIHEFSDKDGIEHTVSFYDEGDRSFGYIDVQSFECQNVVKTPFNNRKVRNPCLQFRLLEPSTIVTVGVSTDGLPVFIISG
jgi:hypothetical protein